MSNQIKEKLQQLPEEPGIYKMLNKEGTVIYIGKSKCLKKRVKSYFVPSPKWEKVKKMAPFIYDLQFIVTDTHLEAKLLECELIKTIKPYFNVIMKGDNRYVFLKVGKKSRNRPLLTVYEREEDCFGPYRSKSSIMDVLEIFRNIYPITKEKRSYIYEYHIFPAVMDAQAFDINRNILLELFTKPSALNRFIKSTEKKMKISAAEERFEIAAKYKNILLSLEYLKKGLNSFQDWIKHMYLLDIEMKDGHKLFFIAKGNIVYKKVYSEVTNEVREEFIKVGKEKSRNVMVDHDNKGNIDFQNIIRVEFMEHKPEIIV